MPDKSAKNPATKLRLKAELVVHWRLDLRISQEEAARKCGISTPTYRKVELGRSVHFFTASRIVQTLGIPIEQLIQEANVDTEYVLRERVDGDYLCMFSKWSDCRSILNDREQDRKSSRFAIYGCCRPCFETLRSMWSDHKLKMTRRDMEEAGMLRPVNPEEQNADKPDDH